MDTRMVPRLIALIRRIHGALYLYCTRMRLLGHGLPQECHHSLATGLLRGTCSTTPEPLCFGLGGAPGALSGAFPVENSGSDYSCSRLAPLGSPPATLHETSAALEQPEGGMGRRALWGTSSSTDSGPRSLGAWPARCCRPCAQIASPDELEPGPSPAARARSGSPATRWTALGLKQQRALVSVSVCTRAG
ncbi:uncharacterized protein TrAtP1_005699 [Trichoderma atroviride]|uniref:uncharacterized protein n=1 Tax=Hypocrea atroviridis TaxID=63577 RepID=UPI00332F12C4|nr:hypothetical protein TrAtP1_005699 [Trichoderma atroviride]